MSRLNKIVTITILVVAVIAWYEFRIPSLLTGALVGAGAVFKCWR